MSRSIHNHKENVNMWTYILDAVTIAVGPLCLWLLKYFGQKATDLIGNYVEQKTHNETIASAIKRVDDAALRIVKSVYMTYVDNIKMAQGRSLTQDERVKAKDMALDKLQSYLGSAGLSELTQIFGFTAQQSEKYLSDQIESAVYDIKNGSRSGLGNGSINLSSPLSTAAR